MRSKTETPPTLRGEALADAQAVASALGELAQLIAATDSTSHRARAYESAAGTVRSLGQSLHAVARDGRLLSIPGIGKSIAGVIVELMTTGQSKTLEELREVFGPGMRELGGIAGLTPLRIQTLYRELGISSVQALKEACEAQTIRTLRGFGPKTEIKLLANLSVATDGVKDMLLVHARSIAERLRAHALGCAGVCRADIVGAVRRWEETVSSIDILATVRDLVHTAGVFAAFERAPDVLRCERVSQNALQLHLPERFIANLTVVHDNQHGLRMVELTGSSEHVARLQLPTDPWLQCDEAAVYQRLGLPYIPPELRQDEGEIEAGRAGDNFADLITRDDIRGMVHCHTTFSDGKASVAQMATAAEKMGMEYITITDHSPSAHYAGGLTEEQLQEQWRQIEEAQSERSIRILRGTESDILRDGQLDYPSEVLLQLDVVIGSVHGRMKMDSDAMTARLISAMRQPYFKIWGHALGRLLLHRPPFACDVEMVLQAASESRVAIEINGDPHRMDLEPRWARRARQLGLRFVISTDAHSVAQLNNLQFGVGLARRAGLRRADVLNALPVEDFKEAVRP